MTTTDRQTRLDAERLLIREASQRLAAGTPERSNGRLTAATLAAEAGLPRHRLYEHHAELLAEFKTTTNSGPVTASVQAMRQQLADARERIEELAANEARLKAQITTLCAIITELTHETRADNVVSIPARTRSNREQT
jgi:hypothetical protein